MIDWGTRNLHDMIVFAIAMRILGKTEWEHGNWMERPIFDSNEWNGIIRDNLDILLQRLNIKANEHENAQNEEREGEAREII